MRRFAVAALFTGMFVAITWPAQAFAQGRFDPRRQARFMIDATVGYTLITGDVGDSLDGGPAFEAAALYQFESVPLRVGGGAGYSRHGIQEEDAAANRYEVFALADLLLFSEDTQMIPYIQGRVGWMQISNDLDAVSTTISGLELAALVGVDIPVAESISIDVTGQFGWFTGGDLNIDGVSVPGTSRSGSLFSLRAGAFFFL
ncbi:MAG: hypothetical protein Q8W45_09195 [Candidatus Palauibacterales bacterium]|nr:hypothetical protein [Candidatus Palauibacterales bacterium]MDP2483444.1 hypothetical protein [Candidatus Palauibacterales bacterium]